MRSVVQLAQIAERCDLATEKIPGHLIIDFLEINGLDRDPALGCLDGESQVNVASGALAEQLRVHECEPIADGPVLRELHKLFYNYNYRV